MSYPTPMVMVGGYVAELTLGQQNCFHAHVTKLPVWEAYREARCRLEYVKLVIDAGDCSKDTRDEFVAAMKAMYDVEVVLFKVAQEWHQNLLREMGPGHE